jgi:hypothetical protein
VETDWEIKKIGVRMSPKAKRQTQKWMVLHIVVAILNFWSAYRNWKLLRQVSNYESVIAEEALAEQDNTGDTDDTPHWNPETGAGIDRFGEAETHSEA